MQTQQSYSAAPTTASHHHQPTTLEEVRTLWIGDLQYWADESYLYSCFAPTGDLLSIKLIRNKLTSQPEGYGFLEFSSHAAADRILQTYNGTPMPGTDHPFRLNWASFGIGEKRPDNGPDFSIFVGDLAADVTDVMLQDIFKVGYPSVRGAKVVTDVNTGRSKGYGFVKFGDEGERNRAMTEMNGMFCSTRPMRISAATPKKTGVGGMGVGVGVGVQYAAVPKAMTTIYPTPTYTMPQLPPVPPDNDITNTTIFVGGLDPNVTEEELKQIFSQCGELIYVKIPAGKGCGFVQFSTRAYAEEAIQRVHGTMIGQQIVRLSWGRSPASKQDQAGTWGSQADPWAAYYGYGYDPYGYAAAQDPSLYGYGAYAGYQYPQQVEGAPDMMAGSMPTVEHSEEPYDPLAIPDVDKLNASYLAVHGRAMLGRPLWLRTSTVS